MTPRCSRGPPPASAPSPRAPDLTRRSLRTRCVLALTRRAPAPAARPADPNLDSPLNGHAASIWHNVPEYKKALLKHKTTHTGTERRAS